MEGITFKFLLFQCVLMSCSLAVQAGIYCGDWYCTGLDPYCCTLDTGDYGCCWNSVYSLWWFWLIFVVVVAIIASCTYGCIRRRRNQLRLATTMANAQYPSYGTPVAPYQAGVPPPYAGNPPTYASQPPTNFNQPSGYSK